MSVRWLFVQIFVQIVERRLPVGERWQDLMVEGDRQLTDSMFMFGGRLFRLVSVR